jgi:hypothetical protein
MEIHAFKKKKKVFKPFKKERKKKKLGGLLNDCHMLRRESEEIGIPRQGKYRTHKVAYTCTQTLRTYSKVARGFWSVHGIPDIDRGEIL